MGPPSRGMPTLPWRETASLLLSRGDKGALLERTDPRSWQMCEWLCECSMCLDRVFKSWEGTLIVTDCRGTDVGSWALEV